MRSFWRRVSGRDRSPQLAALGGADSVSSWIGLCVHLLQRRLADRINVRLRTLSSRARVILFVVLLGIFGGYFLYLLISAFY